MDFKAGDVVLLKSGSSLMTIAEIDTAKKSAKIIYFAPTITEDDIFYQALMETVTLPLICLEMAELQSKPMVQ